MKDADLLGNTSIYSVNYKLLKTLVLLLFPQANCRRKYFLHFKPLYTFFYKGEV
jgi:hypothetical protein